MICYDKIDEKNGLTNNEKSKMKTNQKDNNAIFSVNKSSDAKDLESTNHN